MEKLNCKSLMIGDWVQNPLGWKAKVMSIRYVNTIKDEWEWLVKIGINNNTFQNNLSLNEIVGIPITPEILEANGFGYTEGDEELTHFYLGEPHFCKDMDLHIGTNNRGDFWLNTYNNEIHGLRYVHELQHALRICGKNDITL